MSIKKALQVIQPHSLALENKRRGLEGRRGGGKAQSQLDLHFINVSVKTWQTCDCHSVQFFNTFINRQMIHIWENMNGVALPRNYNSPPGFQLYIFSFLSVQDFRFEFNVTADRVMTASLIELLDSCHTIQRPIIRSRTCCCSQWSAFPAPALLHDFLQFH